ncbi:MAG: hypothetical protein V4598_10955 [Bdellovibrionota bacterium]
MNGVDYTRRLSKEREYFQDSIKKNNEAHKQRLTETEDRAKHVTEKQSENFIKDKAELEKSYQGNLNNLVDRNRESMDTQTDRFNKDISKERTEFAQQSNAKSKDFDQRLNDIKHSYKRAFGSEKENNTEIRDAEKKRYQGNVKDLVIKQDGQLKKYQEEIAGAGADIKDSFKREKQQLVRNQEETLAATQRRHFTEKEGIKKRLSGELAKTKEIHEDESKQLRDYTQDKIVKTEKYHSGRSNQLAADYTDRYATDAEKQHQLAVKTNKQYEDQFDKVRRDAQNEIRQADNLARRRDNGEGEFNAAVSSNREFNGKSIQDHKLQNMKGALEDTKRTYEEMAAADANNHKVTNDKDRAENQAFIDKKTNQLKAEKMVTVANERLENQEKLDHQQRQNLVKSRDYEKQVMQEKKMGDTRVKNLKENFHKSITEIEDKLRQNIEDVTLTANADKKDFLKKNSERTIEQLADMKAEYNRHLDQTVQGYEFRLANAEKDFDELKTHSEQKMSSMAQQSEAELNYEKTTGAERRNAEVRGLKAAMGEQAHQHRMEVNNMMVNYQKQIAKVQSQNDLKLKLITNDYESKLKEAQASKSREIAEKENIGRAEMERLKANYSDDKQRTVATYETKLQQMQDHHDTQMQQLNEFKKLS